MHHKQPLNRRSYANFRNYRLVAEAERMRFVPSMTNKALLLVLFTAALAVFMIPVIAQWHAGTLAEAAQSSGAMVYAGCLLGFLLLSGWIYRVALKPVVFDRRCDAFYYGKNSAKREARLGEVCGVQVIAKVVYANSRRHASYELNVLRQDGKRFKVLDHCQQDFLQDEARQLAHFLKVELDYIDAT
ncbi:hypothetical protein KJY73_12350 [Bowmanella sp. Y26]|uniref:hypothetical protein n=1 Tax=Bowmanella yangjiangensis TaxID=2811230 RepID=UPI001BDC2E35|nr:hypothetical protein [Bowmanella yangjiangensis]MBT1064372.1 hypothetical protein [Bowmanella yangjiangensis]